MRNITVAVSEDSYRQARIWGAKHDLSLSAVVGELLRELPRLARVVREYNADLYARMTHPGSASQQKTQDETEAPTEPIQNQQLTPEESTVSQTL
jgi:hypothetical protein